MARALLLYLAFTPTLAGCGTSSEPGVALAVVSAPAALVPGEGLSSVEGQSLRLSELYWTTAAIELVPCTSLAARVWDVLVPSAYAHGVSTPLRLSVPVVERATTREEVRLGTLHPTAGHYCSVRYELGVADSDAVGLEVAPAMQGRSVDARGEAATAAETPAPFEISSRSQVEIERPIELDLSYEGASATLRIEHEKSAWFDGIDLALLDVNARERRLLENLGNSTSIHVE